MAPTATRAAVSRALARSSTLRMSSWPYFTTPARSAWPGRGRVTGGAIGARRRRPASPAPTYIVRCQFSQSLFGISSAIGAPVVRPWRMPLSGSARSDSISHPASAAVAGLAPAQLGGDRVEVDREAGGHAFEDRDERLAVRLAGGQKSQHAGVHSIRKNCLVWTAVRAIGRAIRAGRRLAPSSAHAARGGSICGARRRARVRSRDRRARHADHRQRRRRVGAAAVDRALQRRCARCAIARSRRSSTSVSSARRRDSRRGGAAACGRSAAMGRRCTRPRHGGCARAA